MTTRNELYTKFSTHVKSSDDVSFDDFTLNELFKAYNLARRVTRNQLCLNDVSDSLRVVVIVYQRYFDALYARIYDTLTR